MATIYHGSLDIIEQPNLQRSKPYNDFGKAFYCTESLEMAKEWACSEKKNGYANEYIIDNCDIEILDLTTKDFSVLDWIGTLLRYRIPNELDGLEEENRQYLHAMSTKE